MADWEELERTARQMQERYNRNYRNMYYRERVEREREIKAVREVARRERDSEIQWLYTGRR